MIVASVDVDAVLKFPATSVTRFAASERMYVPSDEAVTGTVHVILSVVVGAPMIPPDPVPERVKSLATSVAGAIASENMRVYESVATSVKSDCVDDRSTVTVGAMESIKIEQVLVLYRVESLPAQFPTLAILLKKVPELKLTFTQLY